MCINCACLFHANEKESGSEVAASPGDSLFAKDLTCVYKGRLCSRCSHYKPSMER